MDEFTFDIIQPSSDSLARMRAEPANSSRVCAFVRAIALLVCSLLVVACISNRSHAQMYDSFEGGAPRFQLVESDCQAELSIREITPSSPMTGQTCELEEIFCTNGTYAYLAMPLEPSAIIDELAPSIWVQCMSGNVRLGVNVVFPNATHPVTGGRLHTLLWGSTYNEPGHWQRLEINNCEKALTQELPNLRQRYGSKTNFDGAYVDSLVINAYTGPGRYRIKFDDLSLIGLIPISSLGTPVPADWRSRWRWRDGAGTEEMRWTQTANSRIPVWWQYQGESLPWLSSLGFRGLLLNRVPGPAMLAEAQAARLSVISPPPSQAITTDDRSWETVKGWLVGAAVDSRGRQQLESEANRIAQFPESLKRTTIAEVMEEYWSFSRIVDELIVPAPSNLSAGTLQEKQLWLQQSLQDSNRLGSGWTSITTDAMPSWYEQIKQAQRIVEPAVPELEVIDPVQLRLQVARAVAAGAKGFVFRSSSPLDMSASEHGVRTAAMRTVNRDLNLIGPWIMGGQIEVVPKIDREDYAAAAWKASRSQLIIFINNSPQSQYTIPPTRDRALRATMPLPTGIKNVLRVTGGNVQSLLLTPGTEGMTWEIPEPGPIEICVLTDNPLVERYVSRQLAQTGTEAAEDMLDIASHQLQIASRLTAARWPEATDPLSRRYFSTIAAAQRRVEEGYGSLRSGRPVERSMQVHRPTMRLR